MIKGLLKEYETIVKSEPLLRGLDFLFNTNFNDLSDGRYELDGGDYVNVQSYLTKSDADFEAHRRYIDIQYIIEGEEKIGVCDYGTCSMTIPYDEAKDIEFLSGDGEFYRLKKGEFMILYPEDAHKPSISLDNSSPSDVRKAVVKVKI